ncbi:MAG TPA: type II secretion system protein [Planctomycetota bacterium]|nr:type II secretion system protein [Planctomycetota bacterium]
MGLRAHYSRQQPASGFSLVEVLIATFIALIIFSIGFIAITGTIRARGESTARMRSAENARLLFQMLERDFSAAWKGPYVLAVGHQLNASAVAPPPLTSFTLPDTINVPPRDSDVLQFYSNVDTTIQTSAVTSPDRDIFVRYYVNPQSHTLCRQVLEDDTGSHTYETEGFINNASNDQNAMFEDVRQMLVDYMYWDEVTKSMVKLTPAGGPAFTPNVRPTHINVTIILYDRYAEERLKKDPMAPPDTTGFGRIQAYARLYPIPARL